MATWSAAEYSVGIIAGSIPPCRALVLQMIRKFRGEATPNENPYGVPRPHSGYFYSFKSLARIANALSWVKASPEASEDSEGSKNSQKKYTPLRPWNLEANRAISQDSGRECILPLHNVPRANLESGILKTIVVRVGTAEDNSSGLVANDFAQR